MKRPQYVFRPNLNEPQHRRAWALLQQVPPAKRKEFLVQAILATEQTDTLYYVHMVPDFYERVGTVDRTAWEKLLPEVHDEG